MICKDCGMVFDEPKTVVVCSHPEVEGCVPEYGDVCPYCGEHDYIENSDVCKRCGDEWAESELYMGFCEKCQEKLKNDFLQLMKKNFRQPEIDYLFDVVGEI